MEKTICFIEPPYQHFIESLDAPFSLMYLASTAETSGWKATILDMKTLHDPIPNATIYAVTSTSPQWPTTVTLSHILKDLNNEATLLIGGNHITAEPNDYWTTSFDHAFLGEGELKLREFLETFTGAKHFTEGNDWHRLIMGVPTTNLDLIPFPARHLIDWSKYKRGIYWGKNKLADAVSMITSRGCPHNCCYCGSKVIFGRKTRFRSITNVVNEILHVKNTLGYNGFNFHDDTFCLNPKRTVEMMKAFEPLNIMFRCLSRADTVTPKTLDSLAMGGCKELVVGFEWFYQPCLDAANKQVTVKQNLKAMKLIKEEPRIQLKAGLIVGGPRYNWKAQKATENAIRKYPPDTWNCSVFTPYPGTPVWKNPEHYGIHILSRNLSEYAMVTKNHYRGNVVIETDEMSKQDLETCRDRLIDLLCEVSGPMYV